jgi:hypothetical protein
MYTADFLCTLENLNFLCHIWRLNWWTRLHSFFYTESERVPSIQEWNTKRPTLVFFWAPTKPLQYMVSGARGVISRGPNATSRPGSQNDTKNDIRPHIAPNQPYKTIETTVYLWFQHVFRLYELQKYRTRINTISRRCKAAPLNETGGGSPE